MAAYAWKQCALITLFLAASYQATATPLLKLNEARKAAVQSGSSKTGLVFTGDPSNVQIQQEGFSMSMNKWANGAGFSTRQRYVHGEFSARIKLVPKNSAGVVSSFYLISAMGQYNYAKRDEIDWEFLGNVNGSGYKFHTNWFAQGVGHHEEQILSWFDPTLDFHKYTIRWNWQGVIWLVDDIPIRQFFNKNSKALAVVGNIFQPLYVQGSIWDGSQWATDGGRVKADFNYAPFTVNYGSLDLSKTCLFGATNGCSKSFRNSWDHGLSKKQTALMNAYRKKYLVYSYLSYKQG